MLKRYLPSSLIIFFSLYLISCSNGKFPAIQAPKEVNLEEPVVIGKKTANGPEFLLKENFIKNALASELGEGATIEEIALRLSEETQNYYLIGLGRHNGAQKAIKAKLVEDESQNLLLGPETETEKCEAVACDECVFNAMEGCMCKGAMNGEKSGCLVTKTKGSAIYLKFKELP